MGNGPETIVEIAFDEKFTRQMEKYDGRRDPAANLRIRVGGSWIAGNEKGGQDIAIGFFRHFVGCLLDLYQGEERLIHNLLDGPTLILERSGDEVTVTKEVAKDVEELNPSGTTDLDRLASATIASEEELFDRYSEYDEHRDAIASVEASMDELREYVDGHDDPDPAPEL